MLEFIMDKRIKITAFVKFIMIAAASILFMSAASFTFVSFFFAPPVYGAPFAARAVSSYFGFYEVEFYKGSNIVRSLKTSDIDGSGFNDITFLDIEKSRIAVLLNSNKSLSGAAGSDKNAPEAKRNVEDGAASALLRSSDASADLKGETGLNIIKYDERFVRFNIELERKIYDYQFIKLKGDTLESLVLISEPRWLILYRQDKNMQFYEYSKIQLEESNYSKARIAAGDIDSDGLDDIIVMCPDFFISAVNKEYNDFIQDVRYYSISAEYGSEPSQFKIFDINFDGLNDILYSYPSKTSNLRIKFASPGPLFLNDESYDLLNFHSMDFTKINVSGNASGENCIKNVMCCVLENSNRVYAYAVSAFRAGVKNGGAGLRSVYFHKNDRNSKNIRFFYDMNSDGITDACVVNPELGRLGVYYYNAADKVSEYKHFPFAARAAGAFCVRSASKDAVNIISFSRDGVLKSVMNGGGANYEFARLISCCDGAFLASRFLENQKEEKIALLFKDSTEVFLKTSDCDLNSVVLEGRVDYNLDGAAGIEVISHGPAGVASFLVYFKYDGAKIFVKNKDGVFTPAAFTDKNQAAAMKYFNTAVCDYDHDNKIEILYADKNIVRIYDVNLSEAKVFQKNQININSSDFNAQCMYAGQGMIYAYDPDSKRLFEYNVEKRHSKIGAAEKKIDDASLSVLNGRPVIMDYTALNVFASHPELVFDKMNVGDYEDIKNGRYNNLAAKDINGDGSADIILTCGAQNYLDIFGFKNDKFDHSMRFKIFNTKQFSQFSSYTAEPQKIAAADFDGDSYNDLVMLVHNKVIIYFSDSPSKPGAAVKSVKGGN